MFQLLQACPIFLLWLSGFGLFGFAFDPAPVPAGAERAIAFRLTAQDLETAVKEFSAQSGCQVLVPSDLASGVRTRSVNGSMAPRAALERMLEGTPLSVAPGNNLETFALVARPTKAPKPATRKGAALIVVGLAADDAQARRLQNQAEAARNALAVRGVGKTAVQILSGTDGNAVRRDDIFSAVRAFPTTVDDSWLILLGTAASARDNRPAFQISGPRFSIDDLKQAVDALPGHKYVVLATSRSGGFLPVLLPLANVDAVSATADTGEVNEPRFLTFWSDAMTEAPDSSFRQLAAAASRRAGDFYRQKALGEMEHAFIIDRAENRIVPALAPISAPAASP